MKRMMVAMLTLLSSAALAGPKEDMMAADKAFSDMAAVKGAHAAFLAYMTDDVRLYSGPKPPILGKAAAAAFYAEAEKNAGKAKPPLLQWTPVDAEASPDGALGWTRGTWVRTSTKADSGALKLTGYYVTEWRRQADGHYKFDLDIGGVDGE